MVPASGSDEPAAAKAPRGTPLIAIRPASRARASRRVMGMSESGASRPACAAPAGRPECREGSSASRTPGAATSVRAGVSHAAELRGIPIRHRDAASGRPARWRRRPSRRATSRSQNAGGSAGAGTSSARYCIVVAGSNVSTLGDLLPGSIPPRRARLARSVANPAYAAESMKYQTVSLRANLDISASESAIGFSLRHSWSS